MDAEFVDFLDKKFQKVSQEIEGVRLDLKEDLRTLSDRVSHLEEAVEHLTTSIDRMLKMWEDLHIEQKAIIADLRRIKAVLKEKLGVEL